MDVNRATDLRGPGRKPNFDSLKVQIPKEWAGTCPR